MMCPILILQRWTVLYQLFLIFRCVSIKGYHDWYFDTKVSNIDPCFRYSIEIIYCQYLLQILLILLIEILLIFYPNACRKQRVMFLIGSNVCKFLCSHLTFERVDRFPRFFLIACHASESATGYVIFYRSQPDVPWGSFCLFFYLKIQQLLNKFISNFEIYAIQYIVIRQ